MESEPSSKTDRSLETSADQHTLKLTPEERFRLIADVLGNLATLLIKEKSIKQAIQSTINEARDLGVSWNDIGSVTDMSKQRAHYHFGRKKSELLE